MRLKKARLQYEEPLTLQIRSVEICGAVMNFAAILGDGCVVSWKKKVATGHAVRDQLENVRQIQATWHAFAAILGDGSVVTWGGAGDGGHSRAVRNQLKDVQQIQATCFACAAILGDGSVVTWNDAGTGGDSRAVRD